METTTSTGRIIAYHHRQRHGWIRPDGERKAGDIYFNSGDLENIPETAIAGVRVVVEWFTDERGRKALSVRAE